MNLKTYLALWWMAITLAICLATYAAYPNDHSLLYGILGILVGSFLLYWALRLVLFLGWRMRAANRSKKD